MILFSEWLFFINFRHMYTKQMFTLMDWTCLPLNLQAYAQHFLPTLMKKERQRWHFVVEDTLYHHGLWVCCQIAQIQFSILPRLVYAGEHFEFAKVLAWHKFVSPLYIMCVKVILLMIYFCLMIQWYSPLYICICIRICICTFIKKLILSLTESYKTSLYHIYIL